MKEITIVIALALGSRSSSFGRPIIKCSDLIATPFGAEVKIESAIIAPAVAGIPEHCDVRGTIWPEAKFAVKLPTAWNNRFYMVGNGGLAGTIDLAAMDVALSRGFATAGTDTGHDAVKEPGATFARPGPNNPNAERKVTDFAYLAVHETALLGKQVLKAYYGDPPRYSYWAGCSQGGRQGLIEAQRFPDDFDGYIVGAPVLNLSGTHWRGVWNAQVQTGAGAIAVEKLPLLASAVYKKCDALDGVKDGLLDDPRKCGFNPAADLPKCPADVDAPSCFTKAQAAALKKIYGGVQNSAGVLLFPGQPLGAEVVQKSVRDGVTRSGWDGTVAGTFGLRLAESYMKYMDLDPPPGDSWDYRSFDFDKDPARTSKFAAEFNATNPDLQPLNKRGGKIIHYHGWADSLATALMSIDYYESALHKMGAKETGEFYRLFLIPGMFHCRGGVGCDTVDWLTPIVDWVEKGAAPAKLIGAQVTGGQTKRTRPLCPYPAVAEYDGKGSIDAAENFICRTPSQAQ
jgi:feruloyl esterase